MKKLEGLDEYDTVQYFIFENMAEKEPDFCELYATKTKCHEMYELNCYMCGCPHFRFYQSPPLQDDLEFHSVCTIPHGEDYILSNFDQDWIKMMEKVKN